MPSRASITSGPDEDLEQIEFAMLHAISCARRSIRVVTPYFLPPDVLTTALGLAAMRGIAVDIFVPEHSNHRVLDWARRVPLRNLVEAGCHVWLMPPPFDHSKLMTHRRCLVADRQRQLGHPQLPAELRAQRRDPGRGLRPALMEAVPKGRALTLAEIEGDTLPAQAAQQRRAPAAAVSLISPIPVGVPPPH